MNFCLFSPTAPQTLFSLGHLHTCGGRFSSQRLPNHVAIFADDTTLLDSAPLIPHSNLYPTHVPQLLKILQTHPHLSTIPLSPPPPSMFPPLLTRFIAQHPPLPIHRHGLLALNGILHPPEAVPVDTSDPTPTTVIPPPPPETVLIPTLTYLKLPPKATLHRISSAQYDRILAANDLHITQAHIPDQKLIAELSTGKHPYSTLTQADVVLMRRVLGPCPQCFEGRSFKPASIRPLSLTAPASHAGETISFDPQKLPCSVLGGFTQKLTMVDEFSGHISQPGVPSKATASMFSGIHKTIQKNYNSHGHLVSSLHGDAERVNTSLAPLLGAIGIKLKTSLPGHHAHRAERSNQTIDTRSRSVAASLPYHLPPELTLLLHQSVGETLNNSICKASSPQTPNEIMSGFKPQRAPIAFGRCAMVLQPEDKRRVLAKASGSPVTLIPLTELGVSMGLQPSTDRTQWLLANGLVVPRQAIGPLLPPHFTPFNWKPKPIIAMHPPPPPPPGLDSPAVTDPTTKNPSNNPIQYPTLSPSDAMQQLQRTTPPTPPHSPPFPTFLPPQQTPSVTTPPALTTSLLHPPLLNTPLLPLPVLQPSPTATTLFPTSSPTNTSSLPEVPLLSEPIITPPAVLTPTTPPTPQTPTITSPTPSLLPFHSLPLPASSNLISHSYNTRSRATATATRIPPQRGYGGLGSFLSTNPTSFGAYLSTGHLIRKQHHIRRAAIRDRLNRLAHPTPETLTNRSTDLRPIPPQRQQNEFSLTKALLILDPAKVHAAVDKEVTKIFKTYASLRIIPPTAVEPNAVFVPTKLIIREKLSKEVTARMALGGDRQPPHTYSETHAGTSDAPHRAFTLASNLSHAAHHNLKLITFSFDIPAAFLNRNPLTRAHTGNTQLFTRTPHNLPPPHDGVLCEVVGAHYGLKQSNHIYDQDFIQLLVNAGFTQCPSHPYTFVKWSIPGQFTPPSHPLTVSMHVDDGDGCTTSPEMYTAFQHLITDRYGPLQFHSPSRGTCGQVQHLNDNGSITLHCGPYILKMLARIGMDNVPAALCPDVQGLFDPSADPTPLTPRDRAEFRTINGELIQLLSIRHDIKKVVTYLLTKGEAPDKSDYLKQLHLLRYLKSSPTLGPTFSADPSNYPDGVTIHSSSDCAHNVHQHGQSHGAFLLTVGKVGATTAPFLSHSAAEKGVSLSPTEGEYVTLSKTAKALIHYRQFATDLGFPQSKPSIMLEDNASSIKLTTAPLIPSKSRHIDLKHHHVRWAFKTKQILPQHQGSQDIVPDAATKHVGPSRFLYFRKQVFHPPPSPIPD